MSSTTKLFLSPAPGTVIKPTYEYDDEQKEKLQTLREVCLPSYVLTEVSRVLMHNSAFLSAVCILASSPGHRFICAMGAPVAR
jgi:hypothetical protein